ncbi:PcfK-like protein [Flavobacterium aquidurense]|uniref:PcfK-like protein n=1 Tax=Flavobacterium frigidimaris TaxID=262320 RepID=A0ABX4BPD6_FLAFR|nr:Cas9 inhibitor AcrIIA9 family protein [Flavobacterium frigidimaris]OXA78656.1 hypothetical protein B0A65_13070 [Flavobacterium frigidimaris]SDZ58089.1 PcfK-like protein [Flavobacterium aquidurense]
MKASEQFKTAIENYLSDLAQTDLVFAPNLSKVSKNIESCINYIFGEVKKTGLCAFDNQEIFDMAVKYYTDDTIVAPAPFSCKVVTNPPVVADLFSSAPLDTPITQSKTIVKQVTKHVEKTLTLFDL